MPNGHVHARYHKLFLLPVTLACIGAFTFGVIKNAYIAELAVWTLVWYWCGRYVDPDWDLLGVTQAEGRIMRELGPLAPFLVAATAFYAASVHYIIKVFRIKGSIGGSHRTWLTHSIIPGTVGRMLVICTLIAGVVSLLSIAIRKFTGIEVAFSPDDLEMFLAGMFIGLGIADLIHILLDKFFGGD